MASDVITRPAVQEPKPKEIGAQKSPERAHCQINHGDLAAPTPALPDKFVAERNDFLEMGVNRFPAVVVQVAMKFPDAAIYEEFVVRIGPAPPGAAALPE